MNARGPALSMLARPLRDTERTAIARRVVSALRAGRSCELPATAFVSLYERGRVIGCVGHADLQSALGAARLDPRFGGARAAASDATVQLSLLVRGRVTTPAEAVAAIELGTEGLVAFDAADAIRAVLLPEVAADGQRDGASMLRALAEKAGATTLDEIPRVMLVRRERFVIRPSPSRAPRTTAMIDAAARWLAARIDAEGAVAHGIDARSGRVHRTGPFHLGRAAVVIEALAAHAGHASVVRRAQGWLEFAIEAALEEEGEGLPKSAAERAGSLALALRAGADCRDALLEIAIRSTRDIAATPWHAAQVTVALGAATPALVVSGALAPLDADAWAPWSTLAADTVGDARRAKKGRARLARSVPTSAPHRGGVRTGSVPEVAITALVVEVLARSSSHRAATRRALGFLASQCFARLRDVPAALEPKLAFGAFPLAPHADFLRADVTAHVLLALLAARRAELTFPAAS